MATNACGRRCIESNCKNTYSNGFTMHYFPLDRPDILKHWIDFVREKQPFFVPSKHSTLCSAHFAASCYPIQYRLKLELIGSRTKRKLLNIDAIPTIHASDKIVEASHDDSRQYRDNINSSTHSGAQPTKKRKLNDDASQVNKLHWFCKAAI